MKKANKQDSEDGAQIRQINFLNNEIEVEIIEPMPRKVSSVESQ